MPVNPWSESLVSRAWAKLDEAKRYVKESRSDMSVSASQESIELSVKGLFSMFGVPFEPKHEISDDAFRELWLSVPPEVSYVNFQRIWLLNKFWATFYTIAKYGNVKLEAGADKLFSKREAELALEHADEAHRAANIVRSWFFTQRKP